MSAEDFRRFDYVVALDAKNLRNLRALEPPDAKAELSLLLDHVEGSEGHPVADPYYGEEELFDLTWAHVTAGAKGLARHILERK